MIRLTLKSILEFYDMPQVFVATDAINICYLCVLYKQDDCAHYIGVQMSEIRLKNYLKGVIDLRSLYTSPEQDNALYDVIVKEEKIFAHTLLQPTDISEEMLPASGFFHTPEDAIENEDTDTLQLNIPASDRGFFADMVRRMGWNVSTLSHSMRRIAIF